MMKKAAFGLVASLLAVLIGLAWLAPAQAAPVYQNTAFPTPTPGADGRILYLVQSGDTLYWIESVTGVSVEELRRLNNLGVDDVLIAGTYILLGFGGPAEATSAPGSPDQPGGDQQLTPSPTPIMDSGAICVLLYMDVNGDAIRQGEEIAMADGEVSVTERLGSYSQKLTTTYAPEGLCFENILPGTYLVSMALPEGYNRTTDLNATIELVPGDTAFLNFGMQPTGETVRDTTQQSQQSSSTLIGVIGVTLLVVGAGVGIYAAIASRGRFSSKE